MSTSVCWKLTGDGLVSRPGEVKDSHLLNTIQKPEISASFIVHLAREMFGFSLALKESTWKNIAQMIPCIDCFLAKSLHSHFCTSIT